MALERQEITVAICTRNRQGTVCTPITAVLEGTYRRVRVLVIDQSDDDSTFSALSDLLRDCRLEYHRCDRIGVSHARNHALMLSTGPLVLFTDDDCEPGPTWVSEMATAAGACQGAFMIFGPLVPDPRAESRGVVPSWIPKANAVRRSGLSRCLGGLTANAGISREAINSVGLFNTALGRGTPLNAGEDYEYTLRLLSRGGYVVEVTCPAVLHHGVVPANGVRQWLRHDLVAAGTMLGWHCRRGNRFALPQFVHLVLKEAVPAAKAAARFRRPAGLARAVWLSRGFLQGLTVRQPRPSRQLTPYCGEASNWTAVEPDSRTSQAVGMTAGGG